MMRFIMPVILIGISITVFFVFTNPIYSEISKLNAQVASYDEALGNSRKLEDKRDTLTQKLNAINPENLMKLQKLLPDNIDNIRLILEIEQIALPYGMTLKDIKYNATTDGTDATSKTSATGTTAVKASPASKALSNKNYGIWDLEFSTTGSYNNFLNFTRNLESNLRIVDISSIQFSSGGTSGPASGANSAQSDSYKYDFKIRTYWLKN